eukprot:scaffold546_cov115-Cylindrotheca_fusiformis.AAC.4
MARDLSINKTLFCRAIVVATGIFINPRIGMSTIHFERNSGFRTTVLTRSVEVVYETVMACRRYVLYADPSQALKPRLVPEQTEYTMAYYIQRRSRGQTVEQTVEIAMGNS